MTTITNIAAGDLITNSRTNINTNFANLNSDKIETSYLDTDTSLAANSDTKIATQKAVKAYVDAGGNVNASETTRGIVEEATDAEVTAGTATGGTGAKLVVTPAKLATRLGTLLSFSKLITASVAGNQSSSDGSYTIFSTTIPANSLSTTNAIRVIIHGTINRGAGTVTATLRLTWGGTNIDVASPTVTVQTPFTWEAIITANGATNVQYVNSNAEFWVSDGSMGNSAKKRIRGTAAIDSTANQTLSASFQSLNSKGYELDGYTVEVLKV